MKDQASTTEVQCPNTVCGASNSSESRYCGQCGTALSPLDVKYIEYLVQNRIDTLLSQQVKDRKILEVETAEAVNERIWKWAKIYASTVGTALTILALVLGLFGVKSVSDFHTMSAAQQKLMEAENKRITDITQRVNANAEKAEAIVVKAQEKLTALMPDIERMQMLSQKLLEVEKSFDSASAKLESRINSVEKRLQGPELQRATAVLKPYQDYLAQLGFEGTDDNVDLNKAALNQQMRAYYQDAKLFYDEASLTVPASLHREFTHHVLNKSFNPDRSTVVNEEKYPGHLASVLTTYFAASFNNQPSFFGHNLENDRSIGVKDVKLASGDFFKFIDIVGGAMWTIRKHTSREKVDPLFVAGWKKLPQSINRLPPEEQVRTYFQLVIESISDEELKSQVKDVLSKRGFALE